MAVSTTNPTEEVRGTVPRKASQPLLNTTVSGNTPTMGSSANVGAGAVAPMPTFGNTLNNQSQFTGFSGGSFGGGGASTSFGQGGVPVTPGSSPMRQQRPPILSQEGQNPAATAPAKPVARRQAATTNTQPAAQQPAQVQQDIGPLTEGAPSQQTNIGEAYSKQQREATGQIGNVERTNVSNTMKLADKAYKYINDAIAKGNEVDESTRKQVVDRLAEIGGTPELAQEAMNFLSKRFDEKGTNEVSMSQEQITKNQQATDAIMGMDDDAMIQAMKMTDIPVSVRQSIINSDKYKEAVRKQSAKKRLGLFNASISGVSGENKKPATTTKDVQESLNIKNPDDAVKQDIKNIVSDDKLTTLSGEVSDVDIEIADLQSQMQNLKTDIEAEFPTSISKSALSAIIYDRQIGLNNQLQSKLAIREAKVADYERIRQERELDLQRKLQQQKQTMDFLGASNGAALFGTNIDELKSMEESGQIPEGYTGMYKNYQEGLVYNTLAQYGTPNGDDMNVISNALDQGYTPQQILGTLTQQPRFQQSQYKTGDLMQTVKSGETSYQFNPETGRYDIPIGSAPIAGQTQPGYAEITDSTFSIYNQQYKTYAGNTGADYSTPIGTPLPAPSNGTVTHVGRDKSGNIRVGMRFDDGTSMTVDHVDPKTLQHLGVNLSGTGRQEVNIPVSAGEVIGYTGNTGNVKTVDPQTGQWVYVRKDGQLLRPDLAHRGGHASISMYDQSGKMYSVAESDQRLKGKAASNKDLSPYESIITGYMEGGKFPAKDELSAMGVSGSDFAKLAQNSYVKMKKDEYATRGFEVSNPGALSRLDSTTRRDLNTSIDKVQQINSSIDEIQNLVKEHGSEWVGPVATKMDQLYEDILLKAKEVYNLGVLNGPDLVIMEKVLGGRPTSRGAPFRMNKNIVKQFENTKKIFNKTIADKASGYGLTYDPTIAERRLQGQQAASMQQNLEQFAQFSQEIDNRFMN